MADNETIADIIAEMRGMGNYQRYSGDHARVLAGRLDAAHRRERGDCAKLREALKLCMDEMCNRCRDLAKARGNPLPCLNGCEPVRKARAALAEPPRNCDVIGNTGRALAVHGFPTKSKPWGEGEWLKLIDWLFAPATEKEGDNDAN